MLSRLPLFLITFVWGFGVSSHYAQTHTSTLPILVFGIEEINIPNDEKELVTLKISWEQQSATNSSQGPFTHYDAYAGIELRGSSSLGFPKRGYAVELRNQDNEDIDFPLLGMPEEEDWVLHGPFSDKSLLRNAFTYNIAQSTSTWAPKSRFCEVVFNGDYRGVYLLVERIKRDKNRLDIAKVKTTDLEGLDLTGGYLLKIDKFTAEDPAVEFGFTLPTVDPFNNIATRVLYHDPKPEEITEEQKEYIQNWMENFESKLSARDFTDTQFGYRDLIDMESWIDFFLVNELTRNIDGYRLSTFLHKRRDDKGGKLHMGPIWDFNLALGNADYCEGSRTTGWAYKFNDVCPNDFFPAPFHFKRLLQDSLFSTHLALRWQALRAEKWSDDQLFRMFDSLASSLETPAISNFDRWPILGEYVWPNNFVESDYADAVAYTREWIMDRLNWLDREIPKLAPEVYQAFYFGPRSAAQNALVLEGYRRNEYPVEVKIFTTSGQLIYRQKVRENPGIVNFSRTGLVFYKLENAQGDVKTGKLFVD